MEVKMVHKDDDKKEVFVTNQIQREAFLKEGFVDAPEKQQPEPKDGEPAVLPQDVHQAEEMEEAKDDQAGVDVSVQKELDKKDAEAKKSDKNARKDTK